MREKMAVITFVILLSLASIEAGLAYMRELLMQDERAITALLTEGTVAVASGGFAWITTVSQMGIGFILPFALVFVAIPLETFVQSVRTVLGVSGVAILRSTAFVLRLFGNGFHYMGSTLVHIYDLIIFAPMWMEQLIRRNSSGPQEVMSKERRKVEPPELVKEAS